jgi:hypothetical protein
MTVAEGNDISTTLHVVFQFLNFKFKHADLLGHTVIAPILLTKKDREQKAQKDEHPQEAEKNKIAGEFKPEPGCQEIRDPGKDRKNHADGGKKKPCESILERQFLPPDEFNDQKENRYGKNKCQ